MTKNLFQVSRALVKKKEKKNKYYMKQAISKPFHFKIKRFWIAITSFWSRGQLCAATLIWLSIQPRKEQQNNIRVYVYINDERLFFLFYSFTVLSHHFYLANVPVIFKQSAQAVARWNNHLFMIKILYTYIYFPFLHNMYTFILSNKSDK